MVSHFACNGRSHGGGHRPATGVCGSFPSRPKSVQLHLLLSSGAITQRRMMKKKKEEEGWRNKKWFKEKRGEREKEREKKRIFIDKFWSVSEKKKSYFKQRNLSLSLLLSLSLSLSCFWSLEEPKRTWRIVGNIKLPSTTRSPWYV